ncbi:zinc finger protein 638-like [Synchiropus splendidus]|uniref:zinc finger protein 638-like n=1 Tax=Synchiropus splendidus TaxID=270530 RepID=UPI00237E35E6|nr:zinc finger protein 638-like [Synchiropus splendidus]
MSQHLNSPLEDDNPPERQSQPQFAEIGLGPSRSVRIPITPGVSGGFIQSGDLANCGLEDFPAAFKKDATMSDACVNKEWNKVELKPQGSGMYQSTDTGDRWSELLPSHAETSNTNSSGVLPHQCDTSEDEFIRQYWSSESFRPVNVQGSKFNVVSDRDLNAPWYRDESPEVECCAPSHLPSRPKFTAQAAEKILQHFGLEKEDMVHLKFFPKEQLKLSNLPNVMRQIREEKDKRMMVTYPSKFSSAPSTTSSLEGSSAPRLKGMNNEETSSPPPSKMFDYGQQCKYDGPGEDCETDVGISEGDHKPWMASVERGHGHKLLNNVSDLTCLKSKSSSSGSDDPLAPIIPFLSSNTKPKKFGGVLSDSKKECGEREQLRVKGQASQLKTEPVERQQGQQHSLNPLQQPSLQKHLETQQPQKETDPHLQQKQKKQSQHGKLEIAPQHQRKLQKKQELQLKTDAEVPSHITVLRPQFVSSVSAPSPTSQSGTCELHTSPAKEDTKCLPTTAMMQDYLAFLPRVFPHTCSLCTKQCATASEWFNHQQSSIHTASCKTLCQKYPAWDGRLAGPYSCFCQPIAYQRRRSSPDRHVDRQCSPRRSRERRYSPRRSRDRRFSLSRSREKRSAPTRARGRSLSRQSREGTSSPRRGQERLSSPRRRESARGRSPNKRSPPRRSLERRSLSSSSAESVRSPDTTSPMIGSKDESVESLLKKLLEQSAGHLISSESTLNAVVKTLAPVLLAKMEEMKPASGTKESSSAASALRAKEVISSETLTTSEKLRSNFEMDVRPDEHPSAAADLPTSAGGERPTRQSASLQSVSGESPSNTDGGTAQRGAMVATSTSTSVTALNFKRPEDCGSGETADISLEEGTTGDRSVEAVESGPLRPSEIEKKDDGKRSLIVYDLKMHHPSPVLTVDGVHEPQRQWNADELQDISKTVLPPDVNPWLFVKTWSTMCLEYRPTGSEMKMLLNMITTQGHRSKWDIFWKKSEDALLQTSNRLKSDGADEGYQELVRSVCQFAEETWQHCNSMQDCLDMRQGNLPVCKFLGDFKAAYEAVFELGELGVVPMSKYEKALVASAMQRLGSEVRKKIVANTEGWQNLNWQQLCEHAARWDVPTGKLQRTASKVGGRKRNNAMMEKRGTR